MKKLLMATAATALMAGAVQAEEIKLGILLGFTGPLESLAKDMEAGARIGRQRGDRLRAFCWMAALSPR